MTLRPETPEIEEFLHNCADRTERSIAGQLEKYECTRLTEAIRYSSCNGGKRIRPALTYATARTVGLDPGEVDAIACAIELMHCYSLIHDDLPAMDDDDLRRGNPSCHKAFDEATAILAGDAMQAMAFECLANAGRLNAVRRIEVIGILADTAGPSGMAGGQALDVAAVSQHPNPLQMERIHRLKTGTLMSACITMTLACANGVPPALCESLKSYSRDIGLCFQIRDDILDLEANTERLGKRQGSDLLNNKPSYPLVLGLDAARRELQKFAARCLDSLARGGECTMLLRAITHYIAEREF